jgi:hypothetical protein
MSPQDQRGERQKLSTAVDNCVRNYFLVFFTKSKP